MRFHKAIEDLKTKELQIQDHTKKHQEMQIRYVMIDLQMEFKDVRCCDSK